MELREIKECGANNILLWAIQNGADLRSETELQSLINEETYYAVTIEGVNFLELLLLSKMFRNKLRIKAENKVAIPMRKDTAAMFPGSFTPDPEKPDTVVNFYEVAEEACRKMMNMALQMNSDDDIILPSSAKLFMPMITRTFDVQIPMNFVDILGSFPIDKNTSILYNTEYPGNLSLFIDSDEFAISRDMILLRLVKHLQVIRYTKKMETLLNQLKFAPLKKVKSERLISFKMVGFHKYDPVSRNEIRLDMFNTNKDTLLNTMRRLSKINTPLQVDFAINTPLQYLSDLYNHYSYEDLPIIFESSMLAVMSNGIPLNNFKSLEIDEDSEDYDIKLSEYENAISEYKNRILDTAQETITAIAALTKAVDPDYTAIFALLPSIYQSKAIITISADKFGVYIDNYNADLAAMFSEMKSQVISLQNDIANS